MRVILFFTINLCCIGAASPSFFGVVGNLAQQGISWIAPGFFVSQLFDKKSERPIMHHDGGSAATVQNCPMTINQEGKAFVGCVFNGESPIDGAGNVRVTPSDPAALAVQNAVGNFENKGELIKSYFGHCKNYCALQIECSAAWISQRKLACCAATIATLYAYVWVRIAYLQRYIKSNHTWGAWHDECDWGKMSYDAQARLREELLIEVRRRYPLVTDAVPVHCFMNDVEQEITVYTQYLQLVHRIGKLDKVRAFITDRFRDAYVGLLGNTHRARIRGERIFEYCALGWWLHVDDEVYALCVRRREHVSQLKAFYAEWLTTVRAIYKEKK